MTSIPVRRSGAITRSVMRVCGLSVAAYFLDSESERYGSNKIVPARVANRKPLCPSHQIRVRPSARARAMSASRASSFWKADFILRRDAEFLFHEPHALNHIRELLFRGPACRLAHAAIRRKHQPVGGRMLQAAPNAVCDVARRLNVIAFHIH